jgi:hypothetical protein
MRWIYIHIKKFCDIVTSIYRYQMTSMDNHMYTVLRDQKSRVICEKRLIEVARVAKMSVRFSVCEIQISTSKETTRHDYTNLSWLLFFKSCSHNASWLARFKCRRWASRRLMQVMKSSTGLTLKWVATSIILLEWNVCARIPGIRLARTNLHRVNAVLSKINNGLP